MTLPRKAIFIVGAKRTPFCYHGGFLKELTASQTFAEAAKAAIRSANIEPTLIDQTIVGNVNYLSQCDGGKTPRYCGLYSGVPINRPALGVNKSCGTGLQAIITSALDISIGTSKICLVGGTEIMSTLPLLVRNVRFGTRLGSSYQLEDHIQHKFYDSYSKVTIQEIAEATAKKYKIRRKDVDEYTLTSFKKWQEANKSYIFSNELTHINIETKKKNIVLANDQPTQLNEEILAQPQTVQDGEIITAINSATAADGAAALITASEEAIKINSLEPLARVTDWTCVGDDPKDSIAGVVAAMKTLLMKQKLTVNDVDLYEINEIFASDILAIAKLMKLDLDRVNINGGALVLGHPVAATGARMATHLVHELKRRNMKRGIAASQCGVGQGIAVMIERE